MDAVTALERLGGTAATVSLLRLSTRRAIQVAVEDGRIVRVARGRYCLPSVEAAALSARRLTGALCLRSAALAHGWRVKTAPALPEVAVRRKRRIAIADRRGVSVHWLPLADGELETGVTEPLRTVLDCARLLPFDEALAIADSALRGRSIVPADLRVAPRGAGAAAVRRVLAHADSRAANPLESVLRACCIDIGLDVTPQVTLVHAHGEERPDLVDGRRRLVIEAESYAHHGDKLSYRRDVRRYTALVAAGWTVLRFTWWEVMHRPEYVLQTLAVAKRRAEQAEPGAKQGRHA